MTSREPRPRHAAPAGVFALLLMLSLPGIVAAHAKLESASPADGAVVEGTPTEIVATFTEPLEGGSSLSLRGPDGDELARAEPDPDDPTRMAIEDVPDLAPGDYEVRWTASSDDGHLERDTWSFTVVAPPSPSPSLTPSPSAEPSAEPLDTTPPSVAPTVAPTLSPSIPPEGSEATSSTEVLIPIVAVLAIVAVATGVLLSRRGRA